MKTASTALKNLLANNATFQMADLYTFTFKNGTVLRFTSFDQNITLAGNTFIADNNMQVSRGTVKSSIGLGVDELSVGLQYTQAVLSPWALTVPVLLRRGDFDGCTVRVERVFNGTDTSAGSVIIFIGRVADIDPITGTSATMRVRSLLEILQTQVPRNLIQPGCVHTLYDAGCTLSKAAFTTAKVIKTGSTPNTILITVASGQPTGYYDLGILLFTSGANSGYQASIRTYTNPDTFNLNRPLPFVPAAGDTINIIPGCDKTQATCTTKFSNLVNFGGFPYVPQPETAI